MVVKSCRLVAQ